MVSQGVNDESEVLVLSSQPVDMEPHAGEVVRVAGTPDVSTSGSFNLLTMSHDHPLQSCNHGRVLTGSDSYETEPINVNKCCWVCRDG